MTLYDNPADDLLIKIETLEEKIYEATLAYIEQQQKKAA
jgi:hypothetical protein